MQPKRVYVAGHSGMVGAAIVRQLQRQGQTHLITRTHQELDLTDQSAVKAFFHTEAIDEVYLAAAKVGGIYANTTYPADFIYQNLMIQTNVIHSAWEIGVKKLLFLGSSCIYPKSIAQPMCEEALLTGKLEETNEPYAIAKIAGIKMCESYNRQYATDYRSVMPTNLYGPGDTYHAYNSHVVPALIQRFHDACVKKLDEVVIWGTGRPRREFLYVDDMASACIHVMGLSQVDYQRYTEPMQSHINIGVGTDMTIAQLAESIKYVVGYTGNIVFDHRQPDGVYQKLMSNHKILQSGWLHQKTFLDGLKATYVDYLTRMNHS